MKDHIYYVGEKNVNAFIASGGKIEDLFNGKISVSEIPHLTKKYRL